MALGAAAAALSLAPPVAVADDSATRTALEQRIRLAARLIEDSPSSRRIESSGDPRARGHLDEGRAQHGRALELLARGDLDGARRAVDDALQHLSLARRLAPDEPARRDEARRRYEQLSATLAPLIESWHYRIGATGAGDADELTAAQALMGRARQQADAARWDEANQTLVLAEQRVMQGMNRTLNAVTLDYTARPSGPAEEYAEEAARFRAYAELLPLAIRDLQPHPDAMVLITRYREAGGLLQAQANKRYKAGEPAPALADLRHATQYLQRALLAAGLVVPQATGETR